MRLKLKQTYSFQVYPSTLLGTVYQDVTVLAILDRESAELIEPISLKHPLLYPSLPKGTSDNPDDYTYYKIRHPSGVISVIAEEWIQSDTIESKDYRTCVVRLNNYPASQVALLRQVLAANGITDFTITMV